MEDTGKTIALIKAFGETGGGSGGDNRAETLDTSDDIKQSYSTKIYPLTPAT